MEKSTLIMTGIFTVQVGMVVALVEWIKSHESPSPKRESKDIIAVS